MFIYLWVQTEVDSWSNVPCSDHARICFHYRPRLPLYRSCRSRFHFPKMRSRLSYNIPVQVGVVFSLLLSADSGLGLPATPLNISSIELTPSSLSIPGSQPSCDSSMGVVNYDDCNTAIGLFPRDPRGQAVLRNFYTNPSDESSTMPNVLLPLENTCGRPHSEDGITSC